MKKSPLRIFAAACMFVAGFWLVLGILFFSTSNKTAANRDFIEYWSAGQQLAHHGNPYDGVTVLRLERTVGLDGDNPKITFSPPVMLFMTFPLGFVSAKTGAILWTFALLASISVSTWLIWILNGRPDNRWHSLGYIFAPVLACQMAGQLGTFLLLSVVLFLYFHRSRPFLAGAALLPCVWKPHLFTLIALVLLLWVAYRGVYRVLVGFIAAFSTSCVLTFCFDTQVWSQYSQMMRATKVLDFYVPTLSATFRLLIDPSAMWLQFLLEACGCLWAVWYFWTRRRCWDWTEQGLFLLLVSAACAPYAWFSDEAVLLPAVLAALYRAEGNCRSIVPLGLIAGAALIEVLFAVRMTSPFYLWTMPAWIAFYLYATASKCKRLPAIHAGQGNAVQPILN